MPAPIRLARTTEYELLRLSGDLARERADCAVVALAAASGKHYLEAHAALIAAGRKPGHATQLHQTHAAAAALGLKLIGRASFDFIKRYPGRHSFALRSVTTHHPDRFPQVWKDGKIYLFRTRGHILCVKDGVVQDYTRGQAKRVLQILEVVPQHAAAPMAAPRPVFNPGPPKPAEHIELPELQRRVAAGMKITASKPVGLGIYKVFTDSTHNFYIRGFLEAMRFLKAQGAL